ncbi:hypothetical protein A1D22_03335 [Pasteurellaceae bacterium LFhippo2]|nr:hypothetical protein [Pasteurellaceae bacterium LFhippo2]
MLFEWDINKAETNLKKHKVSFELATRVFNDPNALSKQDRFENGEYRWQTIGLVDNCLLLLVAHTVRDKHNQEVIRIISARKATVQERKNYEKNYSL